MRSSARQVVAILVSTVLIGGFAQPATAAPRGPVEALERVQATMGNDAVAVLENSVDFSASDKVQGLSASVPGVVFEAPQDSRLPVRLSPEANTGATPLEIGLPFAEASAQVLSHDEGVVSYDNANDSTTVVAAKADGSVQIATVLSSANAPTRYSYDFFVEGKGELILDKDGRVHVVGESGYVTAVIAPAWAFDARGAEVPTHYEVSGGQLTQVVEHGAQYAYPIVADPQTLYYWWGQAMKFTKSETASVANSAGSATVVTVFCGLIASAPGAVICGVVAWVYINAFANTFVTARNQGKCGQINMPYVGIVIGGPLTWTAHVVNC